MVLEPIRMRERNKIESDLSSFRHNHWIFSIPSVHLYLYLSLSLRVRRAVLQLTIHLPIEPLFFFRTAQAASSTISQTRMMTRSLILVIMEN